MTEEEAKSKWCPFAQVLLGEETDDHKIAPANLDSFNRLHSKNRGTIGVSLCLASACMAWRDGGYCGLAGKPRVER